MSKNKERMMEKKIEAYLQIAILLIATFSFAYLVYQSSALLDSSIDQLDNLNKEKEQGIWSIAWEASKKAVYSDMIPSVKAQTLPTLGCCSQLSINGTKAICQEVLSTRKESECSGQWVPTRCEEFSECKQGCCINGNDGTCSLNSPKASCESSGGEWKDDSSCQLNQCLRGCCILGSETSFVNEQTCKFMSSGQGYPVEFRHEIKNEIQCVALSKVQVEGACVIDFKQDSTCKFTSKQECIKLTGTSASFYEGTLCSNPQLETSCEKQVATGCVDGKDEVYWLDSCGNRENIYSTDKETSWNNGKLLFKSGACNPNSANADSKSCGNCNYALGSQCDVGKTDDGNFICKSLNCVDDGKERRNGESWCSYDGYVGDGKDPVGSRHWRRSCVDGEIVVDPCADFRNEVCVESNIKTDNGEFSTASCKMNAWQLCLDQNSRKEENQKTECEKFSDCYINEVRVGEFAFDVCTPRYPEGFSLRDENANSAEDICAIASQTCTVIYVKETSGWKCVANCECEDGIFTEEMNDLCVSLGDCGGHVNIAGDVSDDGYTVSGAPKLDLKKIIKFATPVPGQKAKAPSFKESAGWLGIPPSLGQASSEKEESGAGGDIATAFGILGSVSGALGYANAGLGPATTVGSQFFGPLGFGETVPAITESTPLIEGAGPVLSTIGNFAIGAAIGAAVGAMVVKSLGLVGIWATIIIVGFAALGALVIGTLLSGAPLCFNPIACGILLIILVVLILLGWGQTKEVIVTFSCMPWQAPTGGAQCDVCNGDPLKPCSKYRCESLGQTCELINEGTDNELCINNNPNDNMAPRISPAKEIITEGYEYSDVVDNIGFSINKEGEECIQEYTPIQFGIKTDEAAQCKLDVESKASYEEMAFFFGGINSYTFDHRNLLNIPSLNSLAVPGVGPDRKTDYRFYVRCQDTNGNFNPNEYKIDFCIKPGPDKTPAVVVASNPINNAVLKHGAIEQNSTFIISEPAECRYSLQDKDYDLMENQISCNTDISGFIGLGWTCNQLFNISSNDNTFYIRCKDQPWYKDTNETARNKNVESYKYILKTSESQLEIISVQPQGTKREGVFPASITLEIETNGGADNGNSQCFYSFSGEESDYISFFNTFSNSHSQKFSTIVAGDYNVRLRCEDDAGNVAESAAVFTMKLDTKAPGIARAFYDGNLKIVTDEEAICRYSTTSCGFDFGNGTLMSSLNQREHSAEWNTQFNYNIKCEDVFGNLPSGCSIRVKAYELL